MRRDGKIQEMLLALVMDCLMPLFVSEKGVCCYFKSVVHLPLPGHVCSQMVLDDVILIVEK